jgi:hypothetical protein
MTDDRSQIFGIDKDYVILGIIGVAGYMIFTKMATKGDATGTDFGKFVADVAPPIVAGGITAITYPFAKFASQITGVPIAQETPTYAQDYQGYSATNPWDTFRLGWNISPLGGTWALR